MTDNEKLEQLFSEQQYMILAVTLDDGTPWAVPVRIKLRWELAFEWESSLETVHSKTLAKHPEVAITIFDKSGETQVGFYAKGKAELVEEYKPGYGLYRFIASQCWINDDTFVKREVNL